MPSATSWPALAPSSQKFSVPVGRLAHASQRGGASGSLPPVYEGATVVLERETEDYKRLIFWDPQEEFLFPDGSFTLQHGEYIVDGYFIPRSGGVHQGVVSMYFEKIDDTKVVLNPAVREFSVRKPCR